MPSTSPERSPATLGGSSTSSRSTSPPPSSPTWRSPTLPALSLTVPPAAAGSSSSGALLDALSLTAPLQASSSRSPPTFEPLPAAPLPRKVGEIGYVPPPPGTPLPRSPARSAHDAPSSPSRRARILHAISPRSRRLSTSSSQEPRKKRVYTVCGLHLNTLLFFLAVALALPGTIAAWVLASMHFNAAPPSTALGNSNTIGSSSIGAVVMFNGSAPIAAVVAQQTPANITVPFNSTDAPGFNSTNGGNGTQTGVTPISVNPNATHGFDNSGAGNNTNSVDPNGGDGSNSAQAMLLSGVIFLHVAFTIGTILELLMIDRLLFQLIQQRRQHLHPGFVPAGAGSALGAALSLTRPRSRSTDAPRQGEPDEGPQSFLMRYAAPWNRPPLPSYRAAIGVREQGTGDVEDEQIVGPAPPEYGNTRGSVLLLQGAVRRMVSTNSRRSSRRSGSTSTIGSVVEGRAERNRSRSPAQVEAGDLDEEGRRDAAWARQLEEALQGIEMPVAPARAARS